MRCNHGCWKTRRPAISFPADAVCVSYAQRCPAAVSGVGPRVIYYWRASHDLCYLVFAYAKAEQEDLTPAQVRALAALMREVLNDG